MKRGPGIRRFMFGMSLLTLLVPIMVVGFLRFYDTYLVRETERGLISESVVIGEAWRERWLAEQGIPPDQAPPIQPPDSADPVFFPYEPRLNLRHGTQPQTRPPARHPVRTDTPAWRAADQIRPILKRSRLANLSGTSILDPEGCVLVSTSDEIEGACLDDRPEVAMAVDGHYGSAVRDRGSRPGARRLDSISRDGELRVYTALPVFSGGKVVAIIHQARTSVPPLKAMWIDRRVVLAALAVSLLLTAGVALLSARAITRPVREITKGAQAVARGEPRQPLKPGGFVPSEVYDLSLALDTMTAQLSDRATYIAEFAANVSHELKTPLTAIGGAAELLRDHWQVMSEDERARFVENISADVVRLQRLVTRLLHLARIQSAPGEAERLEVGPFFERVTSLYGPQLRLNLSTAPEAIVIHADHLESAVRNLIDNAVRHGAGKPVDVTVTGEGTRLVVAVRDYGLGISEGNRSRVFDRFFTTERDRGGTGLGLSIVDAVARTRGGSVTFDTGADGTTFRLTL